MMELDRDMLMQAFAEQSGEGLAAMEESLLALEARPGDAELLSTIFRTCHTLKGDAAILDLKALTEFTHVLEDLLDGLRANTLLASTEVVTLLLRSVDALREMVDDAVEGRPRKRRKHQALVRQVRAELTDNSAEPATSRSEDEHPPSPEEVEGG